ncbi:MAG: zinc ribbon domain-containing protein [Candidatus Helarchaeota archaeon]
MKSGRYLFVIILFFVFLSLLLIFITPTTMGSAKITGYFSSQDGTTHYAQVPKGINASAYVTIDNKRLTSYNLINYSLKITVFADFKLASDAEIISLYWLQNFTLLKGEQVSFNLIFNTSTEDSYPGKTLREFYLQASWGPEDLLIESHYLKGLKIGMTYEEDSPFHIQIIMIILSAIGMGVMLLILSIAIIKDVRRLLARNRISRSYSTSLPPIEEIPAELRAPPEPLPEHHPTETMELISCPECGAKIDKTQIICPNCGNELPKCVVCNLVIEEDEPIETCPECGAIGHRAHFREWVHVKGTCPICKKPLTF